MNCLEFDRQLDVHEGGALRPALLAHARTCERCARALAAAQTLERALSTHLALAPGEAPSATLIDNVLARVRPRPNLRQPLGFAWWIAAATAPSTLLALAVAVLLAWRGRWLATALAPTVSLAGQWPGRFAPALTGAAGTLAPLTQALARLGEQGWELQLALVLAFVPLLLWLARMLYQWSEGACSVWEQGRLGSGGMR